MAELDWVKTIRGNVEKNPTLKEPLIQPSGASALVGPAMKAIAEEPKGAAQVAHEANMDHINRNNPHWKPGMGATYANPVPRAKGGPVKAGGAPMKNVDNSGMTKGKL
jgi:hypothetical protein